MIIIMNGIMKIRTARKILMGESRNGGYRRIYTSCHHDFVKAKVVYLRHERRFNKKQQNYG
jgi:hypothetical protein